MSSHKYRGFHYWMPDRKVDLTRLLLGAYPEDKEKFEGMECRQLRAIVHKVQKEAIDKTFFSWEHNA